MWCPRDKKYFESPKIFLRQTSDKIIATLINEPFYAIDSIHSLIEKDKNFNLKYILAVLNSKFGNYLYRLLITETGKVFAQVKLTFLRRIPIKICNNQNAFSIIVDKILELKSSDSSVDTTKLERKLDLMVYKLYNLTWEEACRIENTDNWMSLDEYDKNNLSDILK